MLLSKYFLLLPLAHGFRLFSVIPKENQNDGLQHALSNLQQDLIQSVDEYLAQDIALYCDDELNKQLESPLSQVFLVVPDCWLRRIESRLPLTDSEQVRSLAALALASEVSHLAPESVCYRYLVTPEDKNEWQLEVTTAPKDLYDSVTKILPKTSRFKGLLSAQDCIELLENTPNKLDHLFKLSINPSTKQATRKRYYTRPWLILLCLAFISQLVLLYSYESEKQSLARETFKLTQIQSSVSSLAKVKANKAADVTRELIQSLPLGVRIDSIVSEGNIAWLGISLESEHLLELLPKWQTRWHSFDFLLMDEWLQPIQLKYSVPQKSMIRTRSVLHVVIQIQT